MNFSTFRQEQTDTLIEPMFMGNSVNVARYDQQRHPIFENIIEKQLSFFWRPEEIDVSKDRADWQSLTDCEKHIFISNLKYQTLLDSVAARSVNVCLLPLVSLPELETWIETWAFAETIHSRSYTHIIRNLFANPGEVFDDIVLNENIIERAADISKYFDEIIMMSHIYNIQGEGNYEIEGKLVEVNKLNIKRRLYMAICAINALEAIRFYVSFACSFAFAERQLLEGNTKIILCERGVAVPHTHRDSSRFLLDLQVIPAAKEITHLPIAVDPSHATFWRPWVAPMSLASIAAGADSIMLEVHPDPENSAVDPLQPIDFYSFSELMKTMDKVAHVTGKKILDV